MEQRQVNPHTRGDGYPGAHTHDQTAGVCRIIDISIRWSSALPYDGSADVSRKLLRFGVAITEIDHRC